MRSARPIRIGLSVTAVLATLATTLPAAQEKGQKPKPLAVTVPARKEPVSYAKEVADILAGKCVGCHSEALAENKLNLEDVAAMLKGGKRGPALVPGSATKSLLFQMAAHRVEPIMPPANKKDSPPLTADELGLLQLWIDSGAKDDSEENAQAKAPLELGAISPGIHPINAVDLNAEGTRVASGLANVVRVHDVDSGLEIVTLGGHKDLIQSLRFSPDGTKLAAGGYQIVSLWNVPTGGLKTTFAGHGDQVTSVCLVSGSNRLVSGSLDKTLRAWDESTGKVVETYTLPAPVTALASGPAAGLVVVGFADGAARVLRLEEKGVAKEVALLRGHTAAVSAIAAVHAREGIDLVVTASLDGSARLWTLPKDPASKLADPILLVDGKNPRKALAVTSDGTRVAVAGDDGKVQIWELPSGKPDRAIEAHGAPVLALAFSPQGDLIATGSADKSARLFDAKSGAPWLTLQSHLGPVNALAFDADGSRVVTGGEEGGLKVWETRTGRGVIAFGHAAPDGKPLQPLKRLLVTPAGTIVSASADKTLKSWTHSGAWSEFRVLGPHAFRVLALDFNPDGTLLAAGGGEPSRSGEIKVWELGKGMLVRTLGGLHSDTVFALRFSPDGTKLASGGADKFVKVTSAGDGKELRAFEGHTHHVMAVDWKADNAQLVSGGADNVLKIWDAASGEQVRTTQPAGKQVTSVCWVPGKALVAGASGDKLVRFWNPDSGGISRTFSGAGDFVFAVAISRDGNRVAAGGADGVLHVWNGQTGNPIRKIEPPSSAAKPTP